MDKNYNTCVEGCNLPSTPNDLKILVKQLIREVEELTLTTEAKLLAHDGKIAELCKYIKDNLSNGIRCLLDSMITSGELEAIINDSLNKFSDKFINIIDPDDFFGINDSDRLQSAINSVCENTNTKETRIIQLNRVYDITGYSMKINKAVNRERLIITGNNGGIIKNDSGYVFEKSDTSYVTDIEIKDTTIRGVKGVKLLKSPEFINVTINNCKLEGIDTIADSNSYMQNIRLVNSLITGGDGNLFEACGFYGLYINGNTIEHRKGYVVKQKYVEGNMYDSCFFIDIAHNLIEGFTEGGIADFIKVHKVNISNNYFENMKNNIVLNTKNNMGSLTVDNNRLYIGTSEMSSYATKGLINIQTNTYPDIHAHSNRVENCYLINIAKAFSVSKKINLSCNDVAHANVNTDFTENGTNKNHEINKFPLTSITGGINKYSRDIPVISDKNYSVRIIIQDEDVRLTLINGEITSSVSINKELSVNKDTMNLYFGIPVYSDDLTDIQMFTNAVSVNNKYRYGSSNDKYLIVVTDNTSNKAQTVTVIATLKTGASIRG